MVLRWCALVPLNKLVVVVERVLQHWAGSAAGAGQPVVVEVVDAALLVGRWDSGSADGADAGVLVCALLSRSLRGQGVALDGAAGSVTNSALSLSGAASRCAALRAASCELLRRAARGWWPRVAREGWVTPRR